MCSSKPKIPKAAPPPPPPPPAADIMVAPGENDLAKIKRAAQGKKRLQIPLSSAGGSGLGIPT